MKFIETPGTTIAKSCSCYKKLFLILPPLQDYLLPNQSIPALQSAGVINCKEN